MIKIVKINTLKQEKAAIEINKDGTTIPHITTMHLLLRYHLEEGQTLTQEEYQRFIKDNEKELLYNKALHYISYQMRTISEVKKQLRKQTKDEELIQSIIDALKQARYLSDIDYVTEYVNEKMEFDLVGPLYIKTKLIQKGIHFDLIDGALIRFTEDKQFEKVTELIQKNIRYTIKQPYRTFIQSLQRKILNKGFTINVIDAAIFAMQEDIMAQIDEGPLLRRDVQKLLKQHDVSSYQDKQKVIQKLLRKGYALPSIKQMLEMEENQ